MLKISTFFCHPISVIYKKCQVFIKVHGCSSGCVPACGGRIVILFVVCVCHRNTLLCDVLLYVCLDVS